MKKIVIALCVIVAPLVACTKTITMTCDQKLKDINVKQDVGSAFTVSCPAGCMQGEVWGTETYTTDSNVCLAAAHAGALKIASGGKVRVKMVKSLPNYTGSEKNGIKSADWATSWGDTAFTFAK
jgi:hypothetical protein